MGCDIHMFVEYRRNFKNGQTWINGDYYKRNPCYDSKDQYNNNEFEVIELHGDRNYSLFSTLAGVRDYSGKVKPISEPKGIPKDATDYVKENNESWGVDGHTHSWLSLKEIREYNSENPKITYSGLISPIQQEQLDKHGINPNSWCQGTNQEGYERREWQEDNRTLITLIDKLQKRAHELFQYDWQEYNTENDENIRIVFWFDN